MSSSASKSGAGDDLGMTNCFIRPKWTVTSAGSFGFDTINNRGELSSDGIRAMPRANELGVWSVSFVVRAMQ